MTRLLVVSIFVLPLCLAANVGCCRMVGVVVDSLGPRRGTLFAYLAMPLVAGISAVLVSLPARSHAYGDAIVAVLTALWVTWFVTWRIAAHPPDGRLRTVARVLHGPPERIQQRRRGEQRGTIWWPRWLLAFVGAVVGFVGGAAVVGAAVGVITAVVGRHIVISQDPGGVAGVIGAALGLIKGARWRR